MGAHEGPHPLLLALLAAVEHDPRVEVREGLGLELSSSWGNVKSYRRRKRWSG